jgi:3-methylfumaryl-CoA hydratase
VPLQALQETAQWVSLSRQRGEGDREGVVTDEPRAWIGRTSEAEDIATANAVRRLAALLDYEHPPWSVGVVPPLGHWLYFLPPVRQSGLATDGHTRHGDFLPPTQLPRRMWAGGRIELLRPIPIGAAIHKRSTLIDVTSKRGASGELMFVTLRHEIRVDSALALVEEQDIVFCERSAAGPAPRAVARADSGAVDSSASSRRSLALGAVELFRFSALTFNAHRIHYDRDYACHEEGYPGLVVHGPYLALLLVDQFLRTAPGAPISKLSYRARSPLFEGERFELCVHAGGPRAQLSALGPNGEAAMQAQIELQSSER